MRIDLADQLVKVVDGQMSLDAFELWLVGHLQAIIDEGDDSLRGYADTLDGLLIQYGEQVVSRMELDEAIEAILRNLNTVLEPSFANTETVSASTTASEHLEVTIRDLGAIRDHRLPRVLVA